MKTIIQILQFFSPKLISKIAYKAMSNPNVRKLRVSEEQMLNESIMQKIEFKDSQIQQYEWGIENDKTALLVHGWEGQAGNFAGIIDILLQKNYHIIAFDAPSHGNSDIKKTNMFEFADFLKTQFEHINPQLIVSHSFGSVNTATIFRNNPSFKLDQWIMVTTPHNFMTRINQISNFYGVNEKAKAELTKRIQKDTNEDINHLNMATYTSEMRNVNNALIVHSKTDKILSIEGARAVNKAFSQSKLIELEDLGHYSILWSDELKGILLQHLN